jgi:hypothetical protein
VEVVEVVEVLGVVEAAAVGCPAETGCIAAPERSEKAAVSRQGKGWGL